MTNLTAEQTRVINDLRAALLTVEGLLNQIVDGGMQAKFVFGMDPNTGKQKLMTFEIMAPLDLKELSS